MNIKLYSHDVILEVPSNKNFRPPSLCDLDSFPNNLHSLRVQRFLFSLLIRLFYLAVSSQAFHRLLIPKSFKIESRVLSYCLVKIVVFSLKHGVNKSFLIGIVSRKHLTVFLSSFGSCTLLKHQCFQTMI